LSKYHRELLIRKEGSESNTKKHLSVTFAENHDTGGVSINRAMKREEDHGKKACYLGRKMGKKNLEKISRKKML